METNQVNNKHVEYEYYSELWNESEDFCRGEKSVKTSPYSEAYLPNPNTNLSDPNRLPDYQVFKNEAPFLGFAGRTLKASAATINRKNPETADISERLQYLVNNINGGGLTLAQQTAKALTEVAKKARFGLLTELPIAEGELSLADNENGMLPTIQGYSAESIINWDVKDGKLSLVVLAESVKKEDELFSQEYKTQYRVLLIEDGVYKQRLYNNEDDLTYFEEIQVSFNGQSFDYIPFDFIGADNNDPTCDEPPMQEIVTLNRDHYRVSAKDMNIINATSMVMTAISAHLDDDEIKRRFPNGISFGRSGYFFPEGTKVEVIQARDTNSASNKAKEIVNDAISLGAKLVRAQAQETATAAQIAENSDNVIIVQCAKNVEAAYNNQLANIALVLGDTNENKIIMNKDTGMNTLTAQERKAWQEDVVLGYVSLDDYQKRLRMAGELEEEIDSNDLAIGLADANE